MLLEMESVSFLKTSSLTLTPLLRSYLSCYPNSDGFSFKCFFPPLNSPPHSPPLLCLLTWFGQHQAPYLPPAAISGELCSSFPSSPCPAHLQWSCWCHWPLGADALQVKYLVHRCSSGFVLALSSQSTRGLWLHWVHILCVLQYWRTSELHLGLLASFHPCHMLSQVWLPLLKALQNQFCSSWGSCQHHWHSSLA